VSEPDVGGGGAACDDALTRPCGAIGPFFWPLNENCLVTASE
jgi:hypothetical protein